MTLLERNPGYVMGDEILEPEDFKREIEQRFGRAYPRAWEQAVQIVEQLAERR